MKIGADVALPDLVEFFEDFLKHVVIKFQRDRCLTSFPLKMKHQQRNMVTVHLSIERRRDRCENRKSNSDVRHMLTVRDSSSRLRKVESIEFTVLHTPHDVDSHIPQEFHPSLGFTSP